MSDATIRLELRITPELAAAIDDWRRQLPSPPPRATAARWLIERSLDASVKRNER